MLPDASREVQYPPNTAELFVDGAGSDPDRAAGLPVLSQRLVVNPIEPHVTDVRHDAVQRVHGPFDAPQVLIFPRVFDSRLLERPCRSKAVDDRLTNLIQSVREIALRFLEIICAATFRQSYVSFDSLVDPPDAPALRSSGRRERCGFIRRKEMNIFRLG